MARRVGRPSKPYMGVRYTDDELKAILMALKKSPEKELTAKIRLDLKERKRIARLYENAKKRIFGNTK